MTTVLSNHQVLSDELITTFAERAPTYDRENRFFSEDFDDLRLAGYLEIAVPTELGGRGMNLAEVCQEQRRLAYRAPATALATNLHIYWTGLAADLLRMGDPSCEWMLEDAAKGEVFAAGHGESLVQLRLHAARLGQGLHPCREALPHFRRCLLGEGEQAQLPGVEWGLARRTAEEPQRRGEKPMRLACAGCHRDQD